MAGQRLDHFARELGTAVDRRGALRAVAGVLLAVAFTWRSHRRGLAQETLPPPCRSDDDCLGDGLDTCMGAYCLDGVCETFVVDCLPGDVCCGNGSCCPGTGVIGCFADADCAIASDDPCLVARCESGQCAMLIVDCAPGFSCCGSGECCPVESTGCVTDADCGLTAAGACGHHRCLDGVCLPGPSSCPTGATCHDGECIPQRNEPVAM
jgi:hypothetical protein